MVALAPVTETHPRRVAPALREPGRGRFLPNLLANLGLFAFSALIGLWFTPYLIARLGTAVYGVVPLVTTLAGYMTVVTLGLNAAVGRFITIAAEQHDAKRMNQYFNTSLWGSFALAIGLLAPGIWCALSAERLIEIPWGQTAQTRWLFGCAVAAFLLSAVKTPFEVSTFCRNRFDLRNLLAATERMIHVMAVVALFSFTAPRMWHVGLGMVVSAAAALAGAVWLCCRLMPDLRISLSEFRLEALRRLVSTGGWVSLWAAGTILFLGIDLLVVNRVFGAESCGGYAAVLQWPAMLRTLASAVAGVFGPTIIYHYARPDHTALVLYVRRCVKFTGLMMALPIGLIAGFSRPLLVLWLGEDYASFASLLSLMAAGLCLSLPYLPLHHVCMAADRVRIPGIVQLMVGAGNLGLAVLLAHVPGLGMYGVALAGVSSLAVRSLVFTPIYASRVLGIHPLTFFAECVPILGASALLLAGSLTIDAAVPIGSWLTLLLTAGGLAIVYAATCYHLLLDGQERELSRKMVRTLLSRASVEEEGA